MEQQFFRQTDEFHVADRATGSIETAFEFSEYDIDGKAVPTGIRKYNLKRGAVVLVLQADGSFSTADGGRTFDRV